MKEELMNIEFKLEKKNWWQRVFCRSRRRSDLTFGRFIWMLYYSKKDNDAMRGFIRENMLNCDDMAKVPSRKLIKRYNLQYENINCFSWWLVEEYFNGNLEVKKKEDELLAK